MKIVSWNVNGLRAVLGKGFDGFLESSEADLVCLQETKARPEQVGRDFDGWFTFWNPAERPGYSGTAMFSRSEPLSVTSGIGAEEHDREGRVQTAEFKDFFVVNVYVPNIGRELLRLGYRAESWGPAFRNYLTRLAKKKPVVFCGDLNVAHEEIDLARPKENVGNPGFTDEEREDFRQLLACGFLDTFRELEKGGGHYSWWSYRSGARERNVGWRIDYVCISKALRPALRDAFIWPHITGSDHCPVGAVIG